MSTIADLLVAKGNAEAQAVSSRGNIYADLIRNLGSLPGQYLQQQEVDRREALKDQVTRQQITLGQGQQTLQGQQIAGNQRELDADALIGQVPRDEQGNIDVSKVADMARQKDPALVSHVTTTAQKLNTAAGEYQAQQLKLGELKADHLGEVGLQLLQKPDDLGSFQLSVAALKQAGMLTSADADGMLKNAEQPGFIAQQANQWVRGSKDARTAVAPKVIMAHEGDTPIIQSNTTGTPTFQQMPGFVTTPKPPTEAELNDRYDKLYALRDAAKTGGRPLTADETSQIAGYEARKTPTTAPSMDEQLLTAITKGDQPTVDKIKFAMQTAAQAKKDPAAAAMARELGGLNVDAAQARLDKMRTDAQPLDISPDVQTTVSGHKYLDGSSYTAEARNKARTAAGAAGVTMVSKEQADALQGIDNARLNQKAILGQISDLLPKDAAGRVAAAPGIALSKVFQTNEQIAAFGTWRTAAINTLRATAGAKGLRINEAEIAQAVENDIPKLTDTLGVAQQKVKNISTLLDNAEAPIVTRDRSAGATGAGGVTVTSPKSGKAYTFPSQDAADTAIAAATAKGLW